MKMIRSVVMTVLSLACLQANAMKFEKEVWTEDEHEVVTPHLVASFLYFAMPTQAWYLDTLEGTRVTRSEFTEFAESFVSATYATFIYTYREGDQTRSRIYYSRSGSMGSRANLPAMRGSFESYFPVDGMEVRSHIPFGERSRIRFSPVEGDDRTDARRNDAEFNAVRTIERDIIAGRVRSGGIVRAYVSRPMCTSCESAVRSFAEMYDVDVRVNYIEGRDSRIQNWFRRRLWRYADTLYAQIGTVPTTQRPTTDSPTGQPPSAVVPLLVCSAMLSHGSG